MAQEHTVLLCTGYYSSDPSRIFIAILHKYVKEVENLMFHPSLKNCNSQNIYQLKIENIRLKNRLMKFDWCSLARCIPSFRNWRHCYGIQICDFRSAKHIFFNWNTYPSMDNDNFQGFPRHLLQVLPSLPSEPKCR